MPITITHTYQVPAESCIQVGKPEIWNDSNIAELTIPAGTIVGNLGVSDGPAEEINAADLATFLASGSGGGATNFLRADGSWSLPSDPWTYVKLASDFTTSSATAVDVTGLSFTPSADKTYEFEALFLLRTATATVGPRPGLAWSTGLSDGAVRFLTTSSATAVLTTNGNIAAAVLVAVDGLPLTTSSYLGEMKGLMVAGASPSGATKVQLASETALTNVTMKAGSFLRYREI